MAITHRADSIVRARISSDTKERAMEALDKMGLTVSDLIRMTFLRVAEEGRIPFEVEVPNKTTQAAMKRLEEGKGERFDSSDELFKDLGI
ncbi:Antitoxin DinJ [Halomonadaceae bacterium LMG 33818]|uniref:type II toxin-antitoxin system RelB/DinJ family antitoxin n=1 Tax=Cernens ardua TaxID=3402176 RepID=UPI003EDB9F99